MTKHLKLLAAFSVVWSVAFFSVLHWCLFAPEERWLVIAVAATVYGLGFGLAGWVLGKRDSQRKVRYDLGWRYSMTSTVISFMVGSLWVVWFRPEAWTSLVIYLLITAVIQLPHFFASRASIKGIEKKELFK